MWFLVATIRAIPNRAMLWRSGRRKERFFVCKYKPGRQSHQGGLKDGSPPLRALLTGCPLDSGCPGLCQPFTLAIILYISLSYNFACTHLQGKCHLRIDQWPSHTRYLSLFYTATLELTTLNSSTLIIPAVALGCTVPKSELSIESF